MSKTATDESASAAGSALARKRWAKKSQAERSEVARLLNDYRWAGHRKARKKGKVA